MFDVHGFDYRHFRENKKVVFNSNLFLSGVRVPRGIGSRRCIEDHAG